MAEARILSSTIYLAFVSACVAMMLYLWARIRSAVIELSVGAGLVTVLLIYGHQAWSATKPSIPAPSSRGRWRLV